MNKTGKIILITLILAGAGVGVYFLYKKLKKDSNSTKDTSKNSGSITKATPTPTPTPTTSNTSSSSSPKSEFPLKKGSKGSSVRELQNALNVLLPTPLVRLNVDGDFGTKTESALKTVKKITTITKTQFDSLILESKNKQESQFSWFNLV